MGKYVQTYPPPDPAYLQNIRNPFHNAQSESPMSVLPPPTFHSHMMSQPRQPLGSLQPNVAANISPARVFGEKPQNSINNGKRPYSAITPDQPSNTSSNQLEIPDGDPRLTNITDDCDRVRYKIYMYLAETGTKMSDFIRAIGSTHRSYHAFMDQSGPREGRNSNVYSQAFAFFKRRELGAVIPTPVKKSKPSAPAPDPCTLRVAGYDDFYPRSGYYPSHPESAPEPASASLSTSTSAPAAPPPKKQKKSKTTTDKEDDDTDPYVGVSRITLAGEDTDSVPIYATCDDIRRAITNHLRCKGVTQAGFLRAVGAQFKTFERTIQGAQLKRFRDYKGPTSGNSSGVFYGAYVLFEKLRIRDGKAKSEKRVKMEEIWGDRGGFEREPSHNKRYIVPKGGSIVMDQYGLVRPGGWSGW